MGLTVEQVIERAFEEILEAGGTARPAWDVQSGTITDSGTTLTLGGRQTYVPPDGLVEWWDSSMEVADVYSTSSSTVTLQTRGYLGTTAASHAAGTKVVLDNPYPRQVLLNGLKAVIGQLYGFGLYQIVNSAGTLTYSSVTPVALPTGAKDIAGGTIWVLDGTNYIPIRKGSGFRLITAFSPSRIQFHGPYTGRALYFDYKKDFDTSTFALTTDLETTVGLPSTLTPHLAQGLAGYILMGRDVPTLESEYIRPDPQNPSQVGTKMNVGRALWESFKAGPVRAERSRIIEEHPTVITGV